MELQGSPAGSHHPPLGSLLSEGGGSFPRSLSLEAGCAHELNWKFSALPEEQSDGGQIAIKNFHKQNCVSTCGFSKPLFPLFLGHFILQNSRKDSTESSRLPHTRF